VCGSLSIAAAKKRTGPTKNCTNAQVYVPLLWLAKAFTVLLEYKQKQKHNLSHTDRMQEAPTSNLLGHLGLYSATEFSYSPNACHIKSFSS
jgi:hypothetical protein